jgi:cytochrome c oxidase subunit II
MHSRAKRLLGLTLSPVLLLSLLSTTAWGEEPQRWQTNMTQGVTEVGHQVYDLHMLIFNICVVIGVGVFGVLFYTLIAHRKSIGHKAAHFHEHVGVELAWTIIPFLILLGMAWPATTTLLKIYDTSDADIDVVVTGYQWKWKYEYLDKNGENVTFFSNLRTPREEINNEEPKGEYYLLEVDEPVVIPVNKKTRFLVTGNDVIHSFWVPALAMKKDAIPGFVNEVATRPTKTGVYRGQCAELCGRDHGFMPIVVNVVEQAQFDSWLADKKKAAAELKAMMDQQFTLDELVVRGKDVYTRSCAACHGANGEGGVGKPIAKSPIATGELHKHLEVVVKGVPGTAMQAFGGQLNEVDLAAVITYQRNAFGNNMGDKVQPVDVYQFKKGQ